LTTRANRSRKHNGKQAEVLYRRAVAIVERELGLDNPALLQPLWWLAESDYRHKAYSKAEATFRRVCDIYEKAGGLGDPATARAQVRLARVIAQQGRYEEAEDLVRAALPVEERTLGRSSVHFAVALEVLGDVLYNSGNLQEAENLYRQTVAIQRGRRIALLTNEDRQDIAMALCRLASAISGQGRLTESEILFNESLQLGLQAFPPGDGALAIIVDGLASVKRRQGQLKDAERHLAESEPGT
jgi:tetratricopeptide (TPR) repeat protein